MIQPKISALLTIKTSEPNPLREEINPIKEERSPIKEETSPIKEEVDPIQQDDPTNPLNPNLITPTNPMKPDGKINYSEQDVSCSAVLLNPTTNLSNPSSNPTTNLLNPQSTANLPKLSKRKAFIPKKNPKQTFQIQQDPSNPLKSTFKLLNREETVNLIKDEPDLNQNELVLNQNELNLNHNELLLNQNEPDFNQTEPELNQTELDLNQNELDLNQTELDLNQNELDLHIKAEETRSENTNPLNLFDPSKQYEPLNLQTNEFEALTDDFIKQLQIMPRSTIQTCGRNTHHQMDQRSTIQTFGSNKQLQSSAIGTNTHHQMDPRSSIQTFGTKAKHQMSQRATKQTTGRNKQLQRSTNQTIGKNSKLQSQAIGRNNQHQMMMPNSTSKNALNQLWKQNTFHPLQSISSNISSTTKPFYEFAPTTTQIKVEPNQMTISSKQSSNQMMISSNPSSSTEIKLESKEELCDESWPVIAPCQSEVNTDDILRNGIRREFLPFDQQVKLT